MGKLESLGVCMCVWRDDCISNDCSVMRSELPLNIWVFCMCVCVCMYLCYISVCVLFSASFISKRHFPCLYKAFCLVTETHIEMLTHALPHTHTPTRMHIYTQTFIHSYKWLIVSWIQHGILQFNISSQLGINTLFLPHSTVERKPPYICVGVWVCTYNCMFVSMMVSVAVNSSGHLAMTLMESKGRYSFSDTLNFQLCTLHPVGNAWSTQQMKIKVHLWLLS